MKFPVKLKFHGRVWARIYGKQPGYRYYRLAYRVAGKRVVRSFATYSEAKAEGDKKARELAKGNQASGLSAREASDALAIRESLAAYRRDTGRDVTALEAVTGYLDASRKLGGRSVADAVDGYLQTVVTVKRQDLAEAVKAFIAGRAAKTKAEPGKRPQLSPIYHRGIERMLNELAEAFPGHAVADLTRAHVDKYMSARGKLAPKSRNDRRAAAKMFLRWCVRQDFLPATHRLFEAESLTPENADPENIEFFTPAELRQLLENAVGPMRALIALQGLGGLRIEEVCRLDWQDVFRVAGHVEVRGVVTKTRARRLVEICPSLAAWLEPYRGMTGRVWSQTPTTQGAITAFARYRESLKIPSRRNGLRHGFVSYHFALHANENLTAQQAGNSPQIIHGHYKGMATAKEAKAWFDVRPKEATGIIPFPAQQADA